SHLCCHGQHIGRRRPSPKEGIDETGLARLQCPEYQDAQRFGCTGLRWRQFLSSIGKQRRSRQVKRSSQEQLVAIQFNGMIPDPIHIPLEEPLIESLLGEIEESVG